MKHARLRQAMARTLIFVSAATAIITVPACNSPRRLETLGEPMVESARSRDLRSRSLDETPVSSRTVKKEEPKKTEITLPINIEKKILEPKDVKEGKGDEAKKAPKGTKKKEEPKNVEPPLFEIGDYDVRMKITPHKPKKEDYH